MAYHEIEKESFLHKDGEERVFFADKDARRRITDLEQGGGGTASGTVTSVNNVQPDANGNVSLSANDVGAGTYSKPSGGIPASDLAAGVIPTVPQMATQANMSDWSAGKTVDAAVLAQDFASALNALDNLGDNLGAEIALKANTADLAAVATSGSYTDLSDKPSIPTVPTNVSAFNNDSGYQTAAQVQTAIDPLQPKAITDVGGYYTTDTVEGALQEIGAELAGINTLIGSGVIS